MTHLGREVAGLWCDEVLARLSDFLDGELDAPVEAQVRQHLSGCRECERFGTDMQALLTEARALLITPDEESTTDVDALVEALETAPP